MPLHPPIVDDSPFRFITRPVLDLNHSASNNIIPASGAGPSFTLLDEEEIAGPLFADSYFFTIWEGNIEIEYQNTATTVMCLHTKHTFGPMKDKELNHTREARWHTIGGSQFTIPMSLFNSISKVQAGGVYGGVTVTEEDVAAPSVISYELEFLATGAKNTVRSTNRLDYFALHDVSTLSYQYKGV